MTKGYNILSLRTVSTIASIATQDRFHTVRIAIHSLLGTVSTVVSIARHNSFRTVRTKSFLTNAIYCHYPECAQYTGEPSQVDEQVRHFPILQYTEGKHPTSVVVVTASSQKTLLTHVQVLEAQKRMQFGAFEISGELLVVVFQRRIGECVEGKLGEALGRKLFLDEVG